MAKTAVTLTKKKTTIRKGQLKKTIKNILCRVDTSLWPEISIEDAKLLEDKLDKFKVDIVNFEKPHWKQIKHLPKDKRPRPPKIQKVDGFIFGISECKNSIQNGQCSAVIINATVNPRLIVQPVLESCGQKNIPVVCMKEFKQVCAMKFGIPTSCLGVRKNSLNDLIRTISEISTKMQSKGNSASIDGSVISESKDTDVEDTGYKDDSDVSKTEQIQCIREAVKPKSVSATSEPPYLYRSSKKTRVFTPQQKNVSEKSKKFAGQDLITFTQQPTPQNQKAFKRMLLKRITNNPNRKTKKKQE